MQEPCSTCWHGGPRPSDRVANPTSQVREKRCGVQKLPPVSRLKSTWYLHGRAVASYARHVSAASVSTCPAPSVYTEKRRPARFFCRIRWSHDLTPPILSHTHTHTPKQVDTNAGKVPISPPTGPHLADEGLGFRVWGLGFNV